MKDTILSVIRLIATPVLLMVLGLILLIHPDSASALVAQILGWVLVIAGVVFAVSAIAGHFDTLGKVLSAVCCFAVGAWLLRNPLMLAAGLGRLAGILLVVRGIQDILNASRYHYGILPAVITTVLGAVLIALPMTTSRVVISLCGLLVLVLLIQRPTAWLALLALVVLWGVVVVLFRCQLRKWVARWMCGGSFEGSKLQFSLEPLSQPAALLSGETVLWYNAQFRTAC